jgi:pimeloyl-ACP methyl ester carboxylesterase
MPTATLAHVGGEPATRRATRRPSLVSTAIVVQSVAFVGLGALSGSPSGRAARVIGIAAATVVMLVVLARGRPASRAIIATIAGIAGTVVGLGIGVMHVVKGDPSAIGRVALIALVTGLFLLLWGGGSLTRMAHGWWRLLALPVAYLVFQFVLIPLTVSVYGTNAPATELGAATPADRGLAYDDVELTTADHVTLAGWYVRSHNGAAVVLLHGSGATRSAVLNHAVVLARRGYGVLLFDARGHGRSGGDANEFGWYGDRDVAAAVGYLERQPDVRDGRVAALGESMGGEEAIGAAASDERIRAVVAEGALWRVPADTAWLAHDVPGLITRAMNWIQAQATKALSGAPEPTGLADAVVATAPRPVLLIAGRDEIDGDRSYRDASPGNVQLWELPDTAHTQGLTQHRADWETRVVAFLDRALAAT